MIVCPTGTKWVEHSTPAFLANAATVLHYSWPIVLEVGLVFQKKSTYVLIIWH
jgi:hypothetical protein